MWFLIFITNHLLKILIWVADWARFYPNVAWIELKTKVNPKPNHESNCHPCWFKVIDCVCNASLYVFNISIISLTLFYYCPLPPRDEGMGNSDGKRGYVISRMYHVHPCNGDTGCLFENYTSKITFRFCQNDEICSMPEEPLSFWGSMLQFEFHRYWHVLC